GDKFDFMIIHESGHEWFANNITYKDIADMWVHEGFTAYSECLYVEYYYGKDAGSEYVRGVRQNIQNDRPIIGFYNVNYSGSGDMYPKGANMLHTLRQLFNDDEKWRQVLRGLNEAFFHQTVTTAQIENYIDERTGLDLTPFFDQYLRDTRIPVFEFAVRGDLLKYRWNQVVDGFDIPLKVTIDGKTVWLKPSSDWGSYVLPRDGIKPVVDPNFYVIPFDNSIH
ncbi:MAG: M1 family aminopeptidase, partial [bacterium]